MTTQNTNPTATAPSGADPPAGPPDDVVDRLAGLLPADELEDALKGLEPEQITGPGGLLTQLAGRVIETALGAELTDHPGYAPGQAPPGGAANTRNGSTAKTVKTELGAVQIKTPRARATSPPSKSRYLVDRSRRTATACSRQTSPTRAQHAPASTTEQPLSGTGASAGACFPPGCERLRHRAAHARLGRRLSHKWARKALIPNWWETHRDSSL